MKNYKLKRLSSTSLKKKKLLREKLELENNYKLRYKKYKTTLLSQGEH